MTAALNANNDGSANVQVNGSNAITISSALNVTLANNLAITGGITGDLKFNSGYGSVATAYGCRAWVNLTDVTNNNLSGTYSQSGTTVTVTAVAHGLIVGNSIYADITTGTGVDGIYTVATVIDANNFTYVAGTSLTTSGNVTLVRNTIRGSGNVSSVTDNAIGDVSVNFAVAMPDVNYATTGLPESLDTSAAGNRRNLEVYPGGVSTGFVRVRAGFSQATQDMPMFVAVFR